MPEAQKPSTGTNPSAGAGKDLTDNPRQAVESGDPKVTGRSHGRIVDDKGTPAGEPPGAGQAGAGQAGGQGKGPEVGPKGNTGKIGQDFESGRQDTL
jgi:hypothetical protein